MNKSLESIFDFLRNHTVEEIARFDIKDVWLEEIKEHTEKKMKQYISSTYEIGNLTPLKKMCCYKISAETLGIDCDVSLFSMVIFRLGFPISGMDLKLQSNTSYKYELTGLDFTCVGDTMNSYATVTRNYIRSNYKNNSIYALDGKHFKLEYSNVSKNNPFEAVILDHYEDIDPILPKYIKEFLEVVHTIGNMIPIPKGCFNAPRNQKTHDYWDITLDGMYKENFKDIIGVTPNSKISKEENIVLCQRWFSNYKNWQDFVEKTFMSPFLTNDLKPILFCTKEMGKNRRLVPIKEEYEKFYQIVTNAIIRRGHLIARKVKNIVTSYSNEALIELYFKDVEF